MLTHSVSFSLSFFVCVCVSVGPVVVGGHSYRGPSPGRGPWDHRYSDEGRHQDLGPHWRQTGDRHQHRWERDGGRERWRLLLEECFYAVAEIVFSILGYSCRLVSHGMSLIIVNEDSLDVSTYFFFPLPYQFLLYSPTHLPPLPFLFSSSSFSTYYSCSFSSLCVCVFRVSSIVLPWELGCGRAKIEGCVSLSAHRWR